MKDKKIHYAWLILVACCAIRTGAYGMVGCPAGLYNSLICDELSFQVGSFVLSSTFSAISMMITQTFASKIYRKFNMRNIMLITGFIYFVSTFLMSYGTELWQWYLLCSIQGIMGGFFNGSANSVLICRWFYEKTAFALGLVDAFGFGVGMLMNPIVSSVLSNFGWRSSYRIFAIVGAIIAMPLVFFVKNSPQDANMEPYGRNTEEKSASQQYGFICKYAGTTTLIAAVLVVFATICNASGGYYQHISSFCVYNGMGLLAGSIMSTCELGGVVFLKLIIGPIVDKLGVLKTEVLLFISSFVGFILMIFFTGSILYPAAFVSGIYSATNSVLLPIFAREQFGEEKYQDVVPWFSTGSGIFTAFSTSIFGFLYDYSKSYNPMFVGCIIANGLSLLAILLAKKIENNKVAQ